MTIRNTIMTNKELNTKQRKAALIALTKMVCGEGTTRTMITRYDYKNGYCITDYTCREIKSNGYMVRLSRVRFTDYPRRHNLRNISVNVEESEKKIVILY